MRLSLTQVIERYQAGFGFVASNLLADARRNLSALPDVPVYEVTSAAFADVTFESVSTGEKYAFGQDSKKEGVTYMGPAIMVSFGRDKKVVSTPIDRSEIEVIEYFGLKPFSIKIQGILIDQEEHQYPSELVQLINEIFSITGTFKVTGAIFQDLRITEIFFDSGFQIDFVEGYADTVKFSVNAIMTHPEEFKAAGV